jgi:hypothetical protein
MTSSVRFLAMGVLVATGACGYNQPYRTSGPVLAQEGVELAVAGERCAVNRSAEQFPTVVDDDRLDLAVDLRLKNQSENPVLVVRDRFQLTERQGISTSTIKPLGAGVVTVLPGETTLVPLEFQQRGQLDCHHELALDPVDAVQMGGKKVALAPIRFTATR